MLAQSAKIVYIISCNWVFNEAGTLESSSILIYSQLQMSFYTQNSRQETAAIKTVIKQMSLIKVDLKGLAG